MLKFIQYKTLSIYLHEKHQNLATSAVRQVCFSF